MKVFLIILAVIVVLTVLILSLSATFTIIYDDKWTTKIKVLWIEKDIDLIKILNMLIFPKETAEQVKEEKQKKAEKKAEAVAEKEKPAPAEEAEQKTEEKPAEEKTPSNVEIAEEKPAEQAPAPKKKNPLKALWDKEGLVGILSLASNLLQSVSSAVGTLFRGFHIHSLYVKIIVGGGDAAQIAMSYGTICQFYYPVKGIIANGMRVDNYDDLIMPDYIAPKNEYGLQFIASISVGLLVKVALSAVKTFVINLIKK